MSHIYFSIISSLLIATSALAECRKIPKSAIYISDDRRVLEVSFKEFSDESSEDSEDSVPFSVYAFAIRSFEQKPSLYIGNPLNENASLEDFEGKMNCGSPSFFSFKSPELFVSFQYTRVSSRGEGTSILYNRLPSEKSEGKSETVEFFGPMSAGMAEAALQPKQKASKRGRETTLQTGEVPLSEKVTKESGLGVVRELDREKEFKDDSAASKRLELDSEDEYSELEHQDFLHSLQSGLDKLLNSPDESSHPFKGTLDL